jgi:hypothetical protein
METLYEQQGPSTIVIVAGDADYMPPLQKVVCKAWRTEVAFVNRGISSALEPYVHEFRSLIAQNFSISVDVPGKRQEARLPAWKAPTQLVGSCICRLEQLARSAADGRPAIWCLDSARFGL